MIFCNLGSGSKGNSSYIRSGGGAVLIDQGFSLKDLSRRMAEVCLSPEDVSSIIITHEHSDHMKGAGIFARRYKIPLYMTEGTYRSSVYDFSNGIVGSNYGVEVVLFKSGNSISIGDLEISTFRVPHDAADPIAVTITDGDKKIGILTDLGSTTQSIFYHIKDVDLLLLESNHDITMLINGPYPINVIQRIKSRVGHLSNDQAIEFLRNLSTDKRLKYLVLGHLSEINNRAEIVKDMFEKEIIENSKSYSIEILNQHKPGRVIEI